MFEEVICNEFIVNIFSQKKIELKPNLIPL